MTSAWRTRRPGSGRRISVSTSANRPTPLGKGGYRRYDESRARELIEVGRLAVDKYGGKVTRMRDDATKKEITERLQEFKGIGPTAARIFLREMAPIWKL